MHLPGQVLQLHARVVEALALHVVVGRVGEQLVERHDVAGDLGEAGGVMGDLGEAGGVMGDLGGAGGVRQCIVHF